jgi:hypothetical protein
VHASSVIVSPVATRFLKVKVSRAGMIYFDAA